MPLDRQRLYKEGYLDNIVIKPSGPYYKKGLTRIYIYNVDHIYWLFNDFLKTI